MLDRREFVRGAVALAMATFVAGCGRQAEGAPDEDAKNATAQAGPAEDPTPQEDAHKSKDMQEPQGEENLMKIQVTVNGTAFVATLDEGTAGAELLARLPLTLVMDELHGNEKHCYTGASFGGEAFVPDVIQAGDLMVFGDDCLVLFYETFANGGWSYQFVGRIDDPRGLAEACGSGAAEVTFATLG